MTPRHVNPNQSQLNPGDRSVNQRNLNPNKVTRGLTRAGSLTGVQVSGEIILRMIHKMFSLSLLQEGKRLKNTRINIQNEDSTINAFNTPEVCGICVEDENKNCFYFSSCIPLNHPLCCPFFFYFVMGLSYSWI